MEQYTPNSYKYKEEQRKKATEEKKIDKVVTGKVRTKKKNKIKDVFIAEDAANVKSYVFLDVLVPAIKKAFSDIVKDGIDMILYGSTNRNRKSSASGNYISYNEYSNKENRYVSSNSRASSVYNFDDLIYESRGEAEVVLDRMIDIIDTYDFVSVMDMYELSDMSAPYTANNYGWTNLSTADIRRVSGGGWMLLLPKAKPRRM